MKQQSTHSHELEKSMDQAFANINKSENQDKLHNIANELFRDNLLNFIRTIDMDNFTESLNLFLPLVVDVYDFIIKNENCDTVEIVDKFSDFDPLLIGLSLDFLTGIDKIESND